MALFSFILAFQIAYMIMGVGHYDLEAGNTPRFRAFINAVAFSRFAVIASLALFVALMRCDPVGAEEEVCYIEPVRTRSFGSVYLGLFDTGLRSSCTPSCSTAFCSRTLT